MAQKYALLVGCTYPNTEVELKGCIHDVNSVHDILIKRFGFEEGNIESLTDKPGSENMPTAYNIKAVLNQFFSGAKSGDVVFLFFAGNGTTIPAPLSASGKDEQAIVPCDYNLITSVDFRKVLHGAPDGVSFIFMSDSCHSGGLIDKETEQIGPDHPTNRDLSISTDHPAIRMIKFESILQQLSLHNTTPINVHAHFEKLFGSDTSLMFLNNNSVADFGPPLKPDHGILLSGCQPDEYSTEKMFDGIFHGAFTWSVIDTLSKHPGPITNRELVVKARKFIEQERLEDQHPCLYCSNENADAFFLCQKF